MGLIKFVNGVEFKDQIGGPVCKQVAVVPHGVCALPVIGEEPRKSIGEVRGLRVGLEGGLHKRQSDVWIVSAPCIFA